MDLNKYNFTKFELKSIEDIIMKVNLSNLLKKNSKRLNLSSKNEIKSFCRSSPNFENLTKSSKIYLEKKNNINYCSKTAIKYHNKRLIKHIVKNYINLDQNFLIKNYLKYFDKNDLFFLREILSFSNPNFLLEIDDNFFRGKDYMNKFLYDYFRDMKVSLGDRLFLI